jgi:hypothetical protein
MSIIALVFAATAVAADSPMDRWAHAVGGRQKLAGVTAIYREGTLEFGGMTGTIKVWHTAEGKYRKEEQVGMFSSVETFDGTTGLVQRNGGAPQQVAGAELAVAKSKAYANSNAIFFVFAKQPRGTLTGEGDTVVFKPEGGIEWRVVLDPETSLPKTMLHDEGGKTVTVTFTSWEPLDGVMLEKEIHRTNGVAGAVIKFTKTVINPPIDASLFTIRPSS